MYTSVLINTVTFLSADCNVRYTLLAAFVNLLGSAIRRTVTAMDL